MLPASCVPFPAFLSMTPMSKSTVWFPQLLALYVLVMFEVTLPILSLFRYYVCLFQNPVYSLPVAHFHFLLFSYRLLYIWTLVPIDSIDLCAIQSVLQCLFAESRWTSESFLHLILSIFQRNDRYCRHSLPERLVFLDKHKLSCTNATSFTTKNNYLMIYLLGCLCVCVFLCLCTHL